MNECARQGAGQKTKFPLWGQGGHNAFGLPLAGLTTLGRPTYAYFFTGKELSDDESLVWYDYGARMYDVQIGRWTSHDPVYQYASPYAFCGNDGINKVDRNGKFALFQTTFEFLEAAFFNGGLDFTSNKARDKAWKNFDPTAEWSKSNKSWKIEAGIFKTDPNKGFWARTWEFISRITWQMPQTALGKYNAQQYNLRDKVETVDYFGGATVVQLNSDGGLGSNGGITLGNYIVGGTDIRASADNDLLRHEYGHYLQSQRNGPTYLLKYGLPSISSASGGGNHNEYWSEIDANERSYQYFNEYYGVTESSGGTTGNRWRTSELPKGKIYNTTWWEYGLYFLGAPGLIANLNE